MRKPMSKPPTPMRRHMRNPCEAYEKGNAKWERSYAKSLCLACEKTIAHAFVWAGCAATCGNSKPSSAYIQFDFRDTLIVTRDAERTDSETYALGPVKGMQSIRLSSALLSHYPEGTPSAYRYGLGRELPSLLQRCPQRVDAAS